MNTTNMTTEGFEARIARLRGRTSVDGWKGPGSVAVRSATWDVALQLIADVATLSTAHAAREPFVSASAHGSLFVRWSAEPGGDHVEAEIRPDGSIECDEDRESGIIEIDAQPKQIASHVRALYAA